MQPIQKISSSKACDETETKGSKKPSAKGQEKCSITELPNGHHPNTPVNVDWDKIRSKRKEEQNCKDMASTIDKEWLNSGKPQFYRVNSGDTLWNIAEMIKTQGYYSDKNIPQIVKELKKLNNFPGNCSFLPSGKPIKLYNQDQIAKVASKNEVHDATFKNSSLDSENDYTQSSLTASDSISDSSVSTKGNSSSASVKSRELKNVNVKATGQNSSASASASEAANNVRIESKRKNSSLKAGSINKSYVSSEGDNGTASLKSNGSITNSAISASGKKSKIDVSSKGSDDSNVTIFQESANGQTKVSMGNGKNNVAEYIKESNTTGTYNGGESEDNVVTNIKSSGNKRTIALGGGSDKAQINFSQGADKNKIMLLGGSKSTDSSSDTYELNFDQGQNNEVSVNTIKPSSRKSRNNDTLIIYGSGHTISKKELVPGAKAAVSDSHGNKAFIGDSVSKIIFMDKDGKVISQENL